MVRVVSPSLPTLDPEGYTTLNLMYLGPGTKPGLTNPPLSFTLTTWSPQPDNIIINPCSLV